MRVLFHSFRKSALAVATVALVAAAAGGVGSAANRPETTGMPGSYAVIKVAVSDSTLTLSRTSSHGVNVVAFVIKNTGRKPHVFVVGSRKSQVLRHGQTQDMPVNFADFGKYAYRVSLNGTAKMRGIFTVAR